LSYRAHISIIIHTLYFYTLNSFYTCTLYCCGVLHLLYCCCVLWY